MQRSFLCTASQVSCGLVNVSHADSIRRRENCVHAVLLKMVKEVCNLCFQSRAGLFGECGHSRRPRRQLTPNVIQKEKLRRGNVRNQSKHKGKSA